MSESKGLYSKYKVFKDGEEVHGCFVLRPETDGAARTAVAVYALVTQNTKLATDIFEWLGELQRGDADTYGLLSKLAGSTELKIKR